MAKTQTLVFKRTLAAKAADIYRAWTNSTIVREWFCDFAFLDVQKGGRLCFSWNDGYQAMGEFTSVIPDKKLAFTWLGRGEPVATNVQIGLAEKKGQTTVTVSHSGLGTGKPWAKAVKGLTASWQTALDNLQAAMETGEDQRISLRPMLGIALDSFDADVAKKLGVPVTAGVRLSGTLAGMGAEAAGLQKDDVVVSLAGKKVTGNSLGAALRGRKGGETVPVKFYRGSQLHTVQMLLSKRPLPAIPATPAQLAAEVQKIHDQVNGELDKVLEGVSEAEASVRPAADEWSVKEVLCHLIIGERGTQSFIAEQLDGHARQYDSFGGNIDAPHTALLAVHSTAKELQAEFKRARRETVALLAAIPAAFLERKSSWWTLCFGNLQPPIHDLAHVTQMRVAIQAARKK